MYSKCDFIRTVMCCFCTSYSCSARFKGVINMSTEVVGTDFFDKAVFSMTRQGCSLTWGENQLNALFLTVLVELFKVMHGGRVDGADTSHTKDETTALSSR